MRIRPAVVDDISAIAALYRILFAEMAALQPNIWRPSEMSRSFLLEFIEGERSSILLAEEDGEIAGFAVAQDRDTPPFNCVIQNRYCYLMDMAVAPARRGRGLGRALLGAAESWARGRGLKWLELNVLEENKAAYKLYEQAGLAPAQHLMRKMLP